MISVASKAIEMPTAKLLWLLYCPAALKAAQAAGTAQPGSCSSQDSASPGLHNSPCWPFSSSTNRIYLFFKWIIAEIIVSSQVWGLCEDTGSMPTQSALPARWISWIIQFSSEVFPDKSCSHDRTACFQFLHEQKLLVIMENLLLCSLICKN